MGLSGVWKLSPKVALRQIISWWFWKRYSPNLSYSAAKVESFDDHGFTGFDTKLNLSIINKNKPLKIDLNGFSLFVIQDSKNANLGNAKLDIVDLAPKETRMWSNVIVYTSSPLAVGVNSNPPDLSKPYDTGIRGIYAIYNKFRKELVTLQNV